VMLEHAPETAFTQDHSGMLGIHHACLNSGDFAGSITGRLISVFSPGTQVADDDYCIVLQSVAVCCSLLQCVTVISFSHEHLF